MINLKIAKIVILLRQGKEVKSIIKENYKELIYFFEKLLINDFNCLDNKNVEMVNDELIKMIFDKIQKEKRLSMSELNVFLYTLYFDAIKFLDLDPKEIKMECVYPEEKKFSPDCGGIHKQIKNKNYVYYNKNLLEKICNRTGVDGRLYFMNMIIHELVHVKQFKDLKKQELNFNSYIISLEEVVMRYDNYYENNYDFTKMETDAKDRGFEFLIKILNKHKLMNKSLQCYLQRLSLQYSNEMDDRFYNHRINYNGQNIKNGLYLLLHSENLLIRNKWLLKEYPLLTFSHYLNGVLKDYDRLLVEKKEILQWLATEQMDDYEKIRLEIECIYDYLFKCYEYGNVKDSSSVGLSLAK